LRGHKFDALECAPNQHLSVAMKHWCELACNCLRKALQINTSAIAVNANRDARALVWCNKNRLCAQKIFFQSWKKFQHSGKY
jgi:hypothetical protein